MEKVLLLAIAIQYFRNMTIGNGNNAIVMGRKTFDSMNNRALQKRRN